VQIGYNKMQIPKNLLTIQVAAQVPTYEALREEVLKEVHESEDDVRAVTIQQLPKKNKKRQCPTSLEEITAVEELSEFTVDNLRKIGKLVSIDFAKTTTKDEMIRTLSAAIFA
jgi:hypothetical protein